MKTSRTKKLSLSKERNKALADFQKLRRLQEATSGGMAGCISCGKIDHISRMDGGHYISRTCRATELEPDNVHVQCVGCNRYMSGNVINYRRRLIDKIGLERVERLEDLYFASKGDDEAFNRLSAEDQLKARGRKTAQDYHDMDVEYRKQIKELESDRI